jgi:hypothetical protein
MVDDLDANALQSAAVHKAMFEQLMALYAASVAKQLSKE